MQAVAESTGPGLQLISQFRKQHSQLRRIVRQFGSIEARAVGYPGAGSNREQLHMSRGVATPLKSTRHSTHPKSQVGHQTVQHTALAHTRGTTDHRQFRGLQTLAQGLNAFAGLTGDHQSLIPPAQQSLNQR